MCLEKDKWKEDNTQCMEEAYTTIIGNVYVEEEKWEEKSDKNDKGIILHSLDSPMRRIIRRRPTIGLWLVCTRTSGKRTRLSDWRRPTQT